MGHQFEGGQEVVVAEEGLLAAISAPGDMMGAARGSNSCDSCHGESISRTSPEESTITILSPESFLI
jgi:hypothetical protein